MLGQIHEKLVEAAIDDDSLIEDPHFLAKLDEFASSISTVRIGNEAEIERTADLAESDSDAGSFSLQGGASPGISFESTGRTTEKRDSVRETRRGVESLHLRFPDVVHSLRELVTSLPGKRLWLLIDEWISLPPEVQPYVGEFLVRCLLPLGQVTVKIAAIEQQARFRTEIANGSAIGIELGADVAANVDLDEFMVFEQDEERARDFFRGLFFKHLSSGADDGGLQLGSEQELVREAFTDKRAFDELLRACEGVPRDAINIAGKAAFSAGEGKISVPTVRAAARTWYLSDKEAAVRSSDRALTLLNWIIDEVIRGKRARGFLVNQSDSAHPLLLALFDARVLHIVRRGYSAQDAPGERFDVWVSTTAPISICYTPSMSRVACCPWGMTKAAGGWTSRRKTFAQLGARSST